MDASTIGWLAPVILLLITVFVASQIGLLYIRLQNFDDISKIRPDDGLVELTKIKRRIFWIKILNGFTLVASVVAAVFSIYYMVQRLTKLFGELNVLASPAIAQVVNHVVPVQPPAFLGFMLAAILLVMLVVFLSAVIAVLFLKDVPENTSRRTAANDIVKTFGGFFIGVLTSFLKQAIGS